MSRVLLTVGMLALAWAGQIRSLPSTLRVLTYNVHHGEGTDARFDLPRLATIVRDVEPDLVALQELDQGTARSGGVNQLTELGQLTGMHAEFGKAMNFEGGGYGVGILSRVPPVHVAVHPLPGSPDREPRTALTVEVPLGEQGALLRFSSTHLDDTRDATDRLAQAAYLNELLVRDDGRPTILAGDLNSRRETEAMLVLETQWTNASAAAIPSPGAGGSRRLGFNHILVRPGNRWRVIETRLIDAPVASDHRPVLVVLGW